MGIYIKGMDMPISEEKCKFYQSAPFRLPYCPINGVCNGLESCPLAPVPPHGRLGDLDALITVYERQIERHKEQAEKAAMKGTGYTNDMYIIDRNRDIISALKAAPTIIPASDD